MLKNLVQTLTLSAVVLLGSSLAHADEKVWIHAGKVDAIDHAHQRMVINDLSVKLTGTTRLYSSERKPITSADIRVGDIVGIDYERVPGIGRTLVELQLYRPGTEPRLDTDEE